MVNNDSSFENTQTLSLNFNVFLLFQLYIENFTMICFLIKMKFNQNRRLINMDRIDELIRVIDSLHGWFRGQE